MLLMKAPGRKTRARKIEIPKFAMHLFHVISKLISLAISEYQTFPSKLLSVSAGKNLFACSIVIFSLTKIWPFASFEGLSATLSPYSQTSKHIHLCHPPDVASLHCFKAGAIACKVIHIYPKLFCINPWCVPEQTTKRLPQSRSLKFTASWEKYSCPQHWNVIREMGIGWVPS